MTNQKIFILKILFIFSILLLFKNSIKSQDSFHEMDILQNFKSIQPTKGANKTGFSLDKISFGAFYGVNFSQVIPLERSSVFSGPSSDTYEKDYLPIFRNFGTQMGFIFIYNLSKIFKISLQPTLIDYEYKYRNSYQWTGKTNLLYEEELAHRLNFFELPLIIGFHTTFKKWQPYYQGGIFYSHLKGANTDISVVETSTNLTGSDQSLEYSTSLNSTNQYSKNQYGLLGGAGIAYLVGGIRISLEANLRFFLSNLNSVESRYQNNVIVSGNYDVPDRFKFSNLAINLNVIVPLVCKNQNSRGGAVFCE